MPLRASSRGPRSTARPARWRGAGRRRRSAACTCAASTWPGNTRTRDEVVRREFRQLESSWYDGERIKLSRRAGRPAGLLQGRRGRDRTRCRARPTRWTWPSRSPRSPPATCSRRRLFQRREARASPRRSSRTTSSARATTWASRSTPASPTARWCFSTVDPVLHGRRHLARHRPLLPHQQPIQQPGRDLRSDHAGRARSASACRSRSTTRCSSGSGFEHTEIGGDHRHPELSYFNYRELYGANSNAVPLTLGWARDSRDSADRARPPAATSASTSSGASPATCATCAPTCSTSSTGRCPCA